MTPHEQRLTALPEALRWRKEVRELRTIIRKWPLDACRQDQDGLDTYDHLRIARECWNDAIWGLNWSYSYRTRAEAVASRDEAIAARGREREAA